MAWTLNGSYVVANHGGNAIIRNLTTGGDDSCSVTLGLDADTDISGSFSEGDAITVANGSDTFFRGIVSNIVPDATGSRESITIEISSLWYWLERIVYQQRYATGDSDTLKYKSRVTLGVDEDGTRQSLTEALTDVVTYANAQGAGITLTTASMGGTDLFFPPIEMIDATCAECIRALLRWAPDAIVAWDHATTGGLSIKRGFGGLGTAISLDSSGNGSGVTRVSLKPRQDRKVNGVVIHYEITSTVDGVEYVDIVDDTSGTTSGKNVIIFTIPLTGNNTTIQSQQITTENIPDDAGDVTDDWINSHFEEIAACSPAAGQVEVVSLTQEVDDDNKVGPGTAPGAYSRELITGQVHEWMTGISAAPTKVTMKLKWVGDAEDNPKLYELFRGAQKTREFVITLMGTDAVTKNYQSVATVIGETPEEGLAADYKAALETTMVEGTVEIVEEEIEVEALPGHLISLTGDFPVTNSIVQTCRTDVFTGRSSIHFGPGNPKLAPPDFIELLRAGNRTRPTSNAGARDSGTLSGNSHVKHGQSGRLKNTVSVPAKRSKRGFTIRVKDASDPYSVTVGAGYVFHPAVQTAPGAPVFPGYLQTYSGDVIVEQTVTDLEDDDRIYVKVIYEAVLLNTGTEGDTDGIQLHTQWFSYKELSYVAHPVSDLKDWIWESSGGGTNMATYIPLADIAIDDDEGITIDQFWDGILTVPTLASAYFKVSDYGESGEDLPYIREDDLNQYVLLDELCALVAACPPPP